MLARAVIRAGMVLTFFSITLASSALGSEIATANGEIPVAGTVTGSFVDTQTNNVVYEAIQEWETDDRLEKKRTSYLEHKWTFSVSTGNWVDFHIKAYHSANSEGDDFMFAWSSDDVSYTDILQVTKTSDDGAYQTSALPGDLSGTVYIRVVDTDRGKGNRSLDTVFVDHMYIESGTLSAPPAAPSDLHAAATSSSTIDLTWIDNSSNEDGFTIERSLDGMNWNLLATVGVEVNSFQDTDLSPATTYYYMVQAFNTYGVSDWSNMAVATTPEPSSFIKEIVDPDPSIQYISHATSPVTGYPGIGYCSDDLIKFAEWNGSGWVVEIVTSGSGNGLNVAYAPDGSPSMCFGWGTINFAERTGSSWSVESIENKCYNDDASLAYDQAGNPSITYSRSARKDDGLKFARRIGATWYSELVENEDRAEYKSLAYDLQGNPAIAYSGDEDDNGSISTLKYARWNGSAWDIEIVEDGVAGYGLFADLAFDPTTGRPAIAHLPFTIEEIRFVEWDGTAWQSEVVITGFVFFSGLAIDSTGTPYVSYTKFESDLTSLSVAHFDGLDWVHEAVDPDVNGSENHYLAIDQAGNPSLSYLGQYLGNTGLIYARE